MEAFRRIDMENLNSVAVKKLGLKMNGPDNLNASMGHQARRASEIPNGVMNRRGSRFPTWEDQKPQERSSADRIDHVGPAPVISIPKQPCSSRNNDSIKSTSNGTAKKNGHLVSNVHFLSLEPLTMYWKWPKSQQFILSKLFPIRSFLSKV